MNLKGNFKKEKKEILSFSLSLSLSFPPPAQHCLPLFLYAPEADKWGPAVRSSFNLQSRVSRAPSWPPAVSGRNNRSPAIKTL
jgi:hypothetical protein